MITSRHYLPDADPYFSAILPARILLFGPLHELDCHGSVLLAAGNPYVMRWLLCTAALAVLRGPAAGQVKALSERLAKLETSGSPACTASVAAFAVETEVEPALHY